MTDDYAELLKLLRQAPGELVLLRQKAADEIEALVKEKNDALERAHLSDYAAERNAKRVDELVKERSELALELLTVTAQRDGDGYGPSDFQRGREAGIREAAEVVTEHYQSMCQEHRLLLVNRATAILALLPAEPKGE